MAYATAADMVARFGEEEMIRLSSQDGALTAAPNGAVIQVALDDATAVIESHLRTRYLLPLNPVPREVVRCCCILARCDLAQGGGKAPSDEMRRERNDALAWLRDMASSEGKLDAPPAATAAAARVTDRERLFTAGQDEVRGILGNGW